MSDPQHSATRQPAGALEISRRDLLCGISSAAFLAAFSGPLQAARPDTGKRLPAPDYLPKDTFFGKAYIDIDEWHERPVRFRYVHGGFEGTATRFSIYLPEKTIYKRRFYQALQGRSGSNETAVLDAITNYDALGVVPPRSLLGAFDLGGYLVESNQGHIGLDLSGVKGDKTVLCYRASAETARFARLVAKQMYGEAPRHGYVYGGSGGGVRSINCLENVRDVWSGAVPIVAPMQGTGTFFSVLANAVRLIEAEKKVRLDDAVDIGGSGKPFEGLDRQQAQALETLYRSGYPRDIGIEGPREQVIVWTQNAIQIQEQDPGYWNDFWNKPGYAGHDDSSVKADRIQVRARVKRILNAHELAVYDPPIKVVDERGDRQRTTHYATTPSGAGTWQSGGQVSISKQGGARAVAVVLDAGQPQLSRMGCSSFIVQSGAARGRERMVTSVIGDALVIGGMGAEYLEGVKVGDEVLIDNGKYIAFCYYHRHQVQPEFREWAHLMKDGKPLYEQRERLETMVSMGRYTWQVGDSKMIFVSSMQDRGCFRSNAAANMEHIRRERGGQWMEGHVRLWLNDHAWHGSVFDPPARNDAPPTLNTRLIDYQGSVMYALKVLTDWVEQDRKPHDSSAYTYTEDCDVLLPARAGDRRGVQPVVDLTSNGQRRRVHAKVGEPVEFEAVAEVPPGVGAIVLVEWDYDGTGRYAANDPQVDGKQARVVSKGSWIFDRPGTYFVTARASSHPTGDTQDLIYRLPNLGRLRVVIG